MQNSFSKLLSLALMSASVSAAANAQAIKTVINLTNSPIGIAANPATNKVYVVEPTLTGDPDSVAVIDGNNDVLLSNITVPAGAAFTAVNYLTNRVYVAGCNYFINPSPCTVSVINGHNNKTIATIPVTSAPGLGLTGITVNPLNGRVYVANGNDNVINIIDGCNNRLIGSIGLNGNSPAAIAINPILDRLYVPYGSNQTAVIDAYKNTILSTTTFGSDTVGVAANFVTGHVFVTDQESGPAATGVFGKNGKVLASVAVDDSPLGVDVDPITNLVFVASSAQDSVAVINGATNTIESTVFSVPANYLVVNPLTKKVYVSGRIGVTVITE